MTKIISVVLLLGCASPLRAQQVWTGVLSDSMCAASHQAKSAAGSLTERQCILECIKALATFVLVDAQHRVIPIANQDTAGLPLYAGRPVRITGEMKGNALVVSKVEAIPAHLHLGHVMTNWRDTPRNVGLLTAAVSDAEVAAIHASLAVKAAGNLEEMKRQVRNVLNALDPFLESEGPASGYGAIKAAMGASQHLQFAVNAEGATDNLKMHAAHAAASLTNVLQWFDQAVAVAKQVLSANSAGEATKLVADLAALTSKINGGIDANKDGQISWELGEGGLQQAQVHMGLLMKAENLQSALR